MPDPHAPAIRLAPEFQKTHWNPASLSLEPFTLETKSSCWVQSQLTGTGALEPWCPAVRAWSLIQWYFPTSSSRDCVGEDFFLAKVSCPLKAECHRLAISLSIPRRPDISRSCLWKPVERVGHGASCRGGKCYQKDLLMCPF